jgi:tetratricopeptide (TPR) repeat protein
MRDQSTRRDEGPPIPDDVTPADLDREIRAELQSLPKHRADSVARHLVMAGLLLDDDPETAYLHARAARGGAGRMGAIREALGLTAYRSGRYAEALAELRAARRITGNPEHLPVMADCERGLGRPERALALAADPAAKRLEKEGRVELRIVLAGARRDLGQPAAAVALLEGPDLDPPHAEPWTIRLWYAYADALLAAGRPDDARAYFAAVATADDEGETDAVERLAQLGG